MMNINKLFKNMDNTDKLLDKKRVFFLLGLLFLLLALPLALLMVQRQQKYQGRAAVVIQPQSVHVTNVYSGGLTVSWVTNGATTGKVKFCGTNVANCTSGMVPTEDIRGTDFQSSTHYVNVTTTNVGAYYFYLLSGNEVNNQYGVLISGSSPQEAEVYLDDNVKPSGGAFKVTTLPVLGSEDDPSNNPPGAYSKEKPLTTTNPYYNSTGANKYASFVPCPNGTATLTIPTPPATGMCFRPNPIYGEVKNTDGIAPFPGSIVYALIKDASRNTKTRMLSVLTESAVITPTPPNTVSDYRGKWVFDMANFYKLDGTGYYGYTPGVDTLKIEVEGSPVLKTTRQQLGIPEVIHSSCYADANAILNCASAPTVPTGVNPVNLTLQLVATPTSTPTPTKPAGATPTPGNKRDVVKDACVNINDLTRIIGDNDFPCTFGSTCKLPEDKRRDVMVNNAVDINDLTRVIGADNFPCNISSPVCGTYSLCNPCEIGKDCE